MVNVATEMQHLHKLARRNPSKRFTKLWRNMTTETWVAQAWEEIRSNRGSRTPGVDRRTADDVDLDRIRRWSERLRTGRYKPRPVRRVHMPKDNGKRRPLGIPAIEDRLVQQALRMVLEPIFEADFLACSHGFRQGHSTHTALREVAHMYPRVSWTIEGDIVGCFDNIPHKQLMAVISRRIADEKVLSLVHAFLKAGYVEDWRDHQTYSGTPQGGILSPLLCNAFLHQLDESMVKTLGANRVQTPAESRQRKNPEYVKIDRAITRARKKLRGNPSRPARRVLIDRLNELEKERKRIPVDAARHATKLGYARYADDGAPGHVCTR